MKRGFSLIEVILSLAILILGLVGVILLFPVGFRASRDASLFSEAAVIAQSHLEEIKAIGYKNIQVKEGEEKGLKWQISFEEVNPDGIRDSSKLHKAVVTISWRQRGIERKNTFTTMVSE